MLSTVHSKFNPDASACPADQFVRERCFFMENKLRLIHAAIEGESCASIWMIMLL